MGRRWEIKPDDAIAYNNLGGALARLGTVSTRR